jgi:hypothetical protein
MVFELGVVKPDARILDATAGNRCIWEMKDSPFILFMDVESELEVKPDIICDNRKMPYSDGYFHTIIFDPPHGWGEELGNEMYSIRNQKDSLKFKEKYPNFKYHGPYTYYGMDKYRSKTQLLGYLNKAFQEFYRILDRGGILFLKWCEIEIPFSGITPFLRDWDIMMKLRIGDSSQTRGSTQTWWVLLMKKPKTHEQLELV